MELKFEKTITTGKELRDIMVYPSEIVTRKAINHYGSLPVAIIHPSQVLTTKQRFK